MKSKNFTRDYYENWINSNYWYRTVKTIKTAMEHLTSAEMIIVSLPDEQATKKLSVKQKIPPNKNAEKQLRFFSTKKVKSRGTLNLP